MVAAEAPFYIFKRLCYQKSLSYILFRLSRIFIINMTNTVFSMSKSVVQFT